MNWAEIERVYKAEITAVPCVGSSDREANWKVVCDRVVEHVRILPSSFPVNMWSYRFHTLFVEYSRYFKVLRKDQD